MEALVIRLKLQPRLYFGWIEPVIHLQTTSIQPATGGQAINQFSRQPAVAVASLDFPPRRRFSMPYAYSHGCNQIGIDRYQTLADAFAVGALARAGLSAEGT